VNIGIGGLEEWHIQ